MFKELKKINSRPFPFQFYTAPELWTDPYTSKKMLEYHLNEAVDLSSRRRDFIECSVNWIISSFKIKEDTAIADFGCGPGLYTNRLAETGAHITGIDFSENSINYAKKTAAEKGVKVSYIRQNYLEFETDSRYDLITMIFCDFCALSPPQRKTMLKKFHRFLKPGGSVLLDVYSLNSFEHREENNSYELNQLDGFWSPEDYYGFLNTFKYDNEKVILDKYTIIKESETRIVYNWLQYFSRESLGQEFEENGLKIEKFYSDVSGKDNDPESLEIAISAKKL